MTPTNPLNKLDTYPQLPMRTYYPVGKGLFIKLKFRAKWAITEEAQTKPGGLQ